MVTPIPPADSFVIKDMTLEEACAEMHRRVYQAALLFEQLEHANLITGNGHHAAQKIAEEAVASLRRRWMGPR